MSPIDTKSTMLGDKTLADAVAAEKREAEQAARDAEIENAVNAIDKRPELDRRPPPTPIPTGGRPAYIPIGHDQAFDPKPDPSPVLPPGGDRRAHRRRRTDRSQTGRKLWMTVGVLGAPFCSTTAALWFGKLSGGEYITFLATTIPIGLAAFHAANVIQKIGLAREGVDPNA